MDFKQKIFEACSSVPTMGSAIAAAYECIFEAGETSTQVQNGSTGENDVAVNPSAITENPDSAKILADIATKAAQQQQQVEQAQEQLDQTKEQLAQTTETAKTTLMELNKEHDAQETLSEQNQTQVPNA